VLLKSLQLSVWPNTPCNQFGKVKQSSATAIAVFQSQRRMLHTNVWRVKPLLAREGREGQPGSKRLPPQWPQGGGWRARRRDPRPGIACGRGERLRRGRGDKVEQEKKGEEESPPWTPSPAAVWDGEVGERGKGCVCQEREGVLPLLNAWNTHRWFCAPARRKSRGNSRESSGNTHGLVLRKNYSFSVVYLLPFFYYASTENGRAPAMPNFTQRRVHPHARFMRQGRVSRSWAEILCNAHVLSPNKSPNKSRVFSHCFPELNQFLKS
jgi:hypothetical protein